MTTILIISTLISVLISFSIWKIWKWFEYRMWLLPIYEELFRAVSVAMEQATVALAELAAVLGIVRHEVVRAISDLKPGGITSEIWAKNHEGEFIVVEKIEVGEKKDGAWPVIVTGKPINDGN